MICSGAKDCNNKKMHENLTNTASSSSIHINTQYRKKRLSLKQRNWVLSLLFLIWTVVLVAAEAWVRVLITVSEKT